MKHSMVLYLTVLVIVLLVSCNNGEGIITAATYPVPGEVIIDGTSYGEAPVSVTLKEGTHNVSFSVYSEQYITPLTRTVRVEKGTSMSITGEYRNRFIPAESPQGFSLADSLRVYGISERKLKDGTIFDYINGGALIYLKHGLRETTHALFRDGESNEILIDIFDMVTFENAQAAFEDNEICPDGFEQCNFGMGCKFYSYEPDFFLYFYKSRYLVFVSTTNDLLKDSVFTFAASIEQRIF